MTGKEFRKLRTQLKMTRRQLAIELDRTEATVCNWEGGRTPVPKMAEMCMQVLVKKTREKKMSKKKKQSIPVGKSRSELLDIAKQLEDQLDGLTPFECRQVMELVLNAKEVIRAKHRQ